MYVIHWHRHTKLAPPSSDLLIFGVILACLRADDIPLAEYNLKYE